MSHHKSHSEKKSNRKKLIRAASAVLAVVIVVAAALLILKHWENQQGSAPVATPVDNTITYKGEQYRKKNVETILFLGLDKYEDDIDNNSYNNDQQADFLTLFVLDNKNATCAAVHINRDTMAEISVLGLAGEKVGSVNKQIALAHTYGDGKKQSCRNTADAVSKILGGVQIHDYISLTMDAVPAINDLAGGVEVTVLHDFSSVDDTLVQGETVTLMGEQALTYVRSRYGLDDSSNLLRMERQRQYMNAFIDKISLMAEGDEAFIVDFVTEISDYMVSNCSVTELERFFTDISSYEFEDIYYIEGENRMGDTFVEFYPDEDSVDEIVMSLFYEKVQ